MVNGASGRGRNLGGPSARCGARVERVARLAGIALAFALAAFAGDAHAQPASAEARGQAEAEGSPPRPFVLAQDARTLAPGTTEVSYFASWGFGRERLPIGAEQFGRYGLVQHVELEAGFLNFLSVRAVGMVLVPPGESDLPVAAGISARARVLGQNRLGFQLSAEIGAVREFSGNGTVYGMVLASDEIGPLRFTFNVALEHSFAPGADPINTVVMVGAVYRAARPLWLGLEYLSEDLLAAEDLEHERGPRSMLGPTVVFATMGEHLQFRAAVYAGLSHLSPDALVRLGAAYEF